MMPVIYWLVSSYPDAEERGSCEYSTASHHGVAVAMEGLGTRLYTGVIVCAQLRAQILHDQTFLTCYVSSSMMPVPCCYQCMILYNNKVVFLG